MRSAEPSRRHTTRVHFRILMADVKRAAEFRRGIRGPRDRTLDRCRAAVRLKLRDCGGLREGAVADAVVFDPETVIGRPTGPRMARVLERGA